MRRLVLIRGSSGSGKSWLAKLIEQANNAGKLVRNTIVLATDDFWTEDNPWNRKQVEEAHAWNQERVRSQMEKWRKTEESTIIVPNTLPKISYMHPYLQMADYFGFVIQDILMCRELVTCAAENAWSNVPTGQIRGQIHNIEWLPLDTLMGCIRGTLTDQYCYDCCQAPCACKKEEV